ncbi:hypothetical protein MXB_2811 [Myxobolus squamalis]|nr:hypothetical protein MXB_2811 [Myxobolus squamalis]
MSLSFLTFILEALKNCAINRSKLFQILCDYCFIHRQKFGPFLDDASKIEIAIADYVDEILGLNIPDKTDIISFGKLVHCNFLNDNISLKIFCFIKFDVHACIIIYLGN